jgi:lipoate-protein ligase B
VAWLGRVAYPVAVALQESLRRRILDGEASAETLLLLEHDPVITLGRAAHDEDILVSEAELAARGVAVARSSRGGEVTYHGPGQLVAYPVLRLGRGVVAHVEAMAQAVIEVAGAYGVAARFRRERPGVWVGEHKLASLGIHVHRRVAIHGVALNISTALESFDWIVPCGLRATRVTSLAALSGRDLPVTEVALRFAAAFARTLGRTKIDPIPSLLSGSPPVE